MKRYPYIGSRWAGAWLWLLVDGDGACSYQAAIGGERSEPTDLRTAWYAGRSMLRRYLRHLRT